MFETLSTPHFWVGLLEIIGVNILLSGDNAVVIALAARSLPARQRSRAVLLGSIAAIAMRVVLTLAAAEVLDLPYLKVLGAVALLWIGIRLLLPGHGNTSEAPSNRTLFAAIRTILVADVVMSLDNVIAVAAAAEGDLTLLVLGLLISVPLIAFGSTLVLKLMDRFPILIAAGGALLGYVAGEMVMRETALRLWLPPENSPWSITLPAVGALLVVSIGKWLAGRRDEAGPQRVIELNDGERK
jgi:YjbE family integral membrane protein